MESVQTDKTHPDCVRFTHKKSPLPAVEAPDPRFYSGRNPVPRIEESFWELVPDMGSSSESDRGGLERQQKKRLTKTKTVLDPITGRK